MRNQVFGIAIVAALALPTASAISQDGTYMNPADVGRGLVMPSAIEADARRRGAARKFDRKSSSEASARRNCADLPMFRRRLGNDDPRLVKMGALCRELGYR